MKTLKIRFVKRSDDYLIQRKGLFGWRYMRYMDALDSMGSGLPSYFLYCATTKEELLSQIINDNFKVKREYINIVEYPMLKFL